MERRTKKNSIVVVKRERKRVLAIVLAILMVVSAIDFGGMQYVSAADEDTTNVITALAGLPGEIANQQLVVGSPESAINLPDSLSVASEVYNVDEAQAVTGSAISVNLTYNLTGVTWEIDADQSSSASFDSSVGNTYYTYIPVLPTTDSEGISIRLADSVSLPYIRVQIVGTDEASVTEADGTPHYYTTVEAAIIAAMSMNGSTVTLLKDAETTDNVIINSGDFTIDLNGKTLTCNQLNIATGAVLSMQDSSGNNSGSYIGAIFTEGELNISGGTYKYTGDINYTYTLETLTIRRYITIYAKNGSSGEISGGIFQRNGYTTAYYALAYESNSSLKVLGGYFDSINGLASNTGNKLPVGYCLMNSDNNTPVPYPGGQNNFFSYITVEQCTEHDYGTQRYCRYCHTENPDYGGPVWVTIDGTTTKYEAAEIANAFAAANGNTAAITLNTDVYASNLSLTSGTIIIDLNGYKLLSGTQYSHIFDLNGAEVILKNGTVQIAERNNGIRLSSGSLTIESVTFSSVSYTAASLDIQGGTVEINGANFQYYDSIEQKAGHLTVSEGSFGGTVELNGGETLLEGGHYSEIIIDDNDPRNIADLLPMGAMMKSDTGTVYSKDQLRIKGISQVAVLEAPIIITAQPQNTESVTYGYFFRSSFTRTMSVTAEKTSTASEDSSIAYQWYRVKSGSETSDTALGTADTQTMPSGLDAGTYSFYCVITCGDYIVNSQSADFIVEKAAPRIGLDVINLGDTPFIYGEGVYLQAMINGENGEHPDGRVTFMIDGVIVTTVDYDYDDGHDYFCQTGIIQAFDAGKHSFTAIYHPSTDGTGKNYESASSATVERTIAKADQSISITEVSGKKYNDADFTLETTGGSGTGAVTFSVPEDNGVLSISQKEDGRFYAAIIGAGEVTVTAIKAEDTNYNEATDMQLITIEKAAAPSITWPNASSIIYGQKLSASALSVSSTEYGTFAWTDGSTVPTVTNGGYEVTFTPNAGTVANYEAITNTTKMVAITVSKATPAVTVSADISDDAGSRKATLTATVTGTGDGETPTGTVKFTGSTSGSDVDIEGATAVTITGGKATYTWTGLANQIYKVKAVYNGSANYNTATSTEITFDTNKENQAALNIGSIGTKTYGDGTFTLSATGGSGGGAVTFESSDSTIVSISGTTATIHKAGSVTITATKAATDTYNEASASVSLIVGKKVLTVKADNKLNIIKGAVMPALTYTVTGLVGSDTFIDPILSTTATDTKTLGEYDITISGGTFANADNYTINYTSGKLTIINEPVSPGGLSGGGSSNGGGSSTATPQPDAGTPVIKGASNQAGWKAIKEQIGQTREGDTVTIEMNGSLVVPGEVLDAIRGTDTTLVFDMGEGITWSINGQSITANSLNDVNLDITLDTDAIPAGIISQMAGEQDSNTLSLAYDGPFGFTSVLTINLNKINAGKYGNLFYYNPVTKQLTLQAVEKIGEKGNVELPFPHASDYVVIISEKPMLEKTLDQIEISAVKGTLYVGGTEKKSMTLKFKLPQLLEEAVEKDSSIRKITYQSSNPKVATVNASGKIIAKKAGKTTVTTLVTINGVQRKFRTIITVSKAYIKLIGSTNTLKTGDTFTYKAVGYGVKTEDIMFYTSKKSVVVINKTTGKAKARTKGTDYIIAKAGKVKVKIKVKVS
ncbi:Ig-like domain repeat protein [Lachnospiraceae bacterium MD1]|uniref:Ig-like domain repeat protein n=1 Tax=Variimorphobacter saccharofermentans TaxID=2755051 RepID=A0A839JVX9_9FIRM|nr:Ig-like domain repeat protein [Variimorphobacter saccharofermentans]MBB2181813.1 Ig-like domain repeat protein [Variimorphobacter saccharofermentans]